MSTLRIELEVAAEAQKAIALMGVQGDVLRAGLLRGARRGAALIDQRFARNLNNVEVGVRSGSLIRSRVVRVETDERGMPVVRVGYLTEALVDRYAAVQELGTQGAGGELPDITPEKARALAIPLRAARDQRGIPIYQGPRDPALAGELFMVKRPGKPPLLARTAPDGKSVEPMFALVPRVRIRPKRPARKAINQSSAQFGEELVRGVTREQKLRAASADPAKSTPPSSDQ
ncbi:MAG: hypothetical protein KF684_04100 [Phycisphaeraceae bacterium]|nr:hypothetical protein [Phycisphaeraceae bacterium]